MHRRVLPGLVAVPLLASQAEAQTTSPREIVLAFYETVFRRKQVAEGFARYVAPPYTQHNPRVPDGPAPAIAYLGGRFRDNPEASSELKRVLAEGDLVALHTHSCLNPGDRGVAIVDIFRVAEGKIVEHWDVIQPVPETSANPNGMF